MKIYQPLCISVVLLIILLYVFLLNSPVIFDTKPLPQRHLKGSVHLGTHSAYGKWRFFPYPDYKLSLYKIIPLIRTKNPTTINFRRINSRTYRWLTCKWNYNINKSGSNILILPNCGFTINE